MNPSPKPAAALVAAAALTAAAEARAHHSFNATFDASRVIELEGEVTQVRWRNPHVSFDLRVTRDDGSVDVVDVETLAISGLRRRDIVEPFVDTGDEVRVAGNPARERPDNLYLRNILLPSGEEIVLQGEAEARFSERLLGTTGATYATEGDGSRPELGIFRVWSTPEASPFPWPENVDPELAHTDFPLTESARAELEAFDPEQDDPIANCARKGMPTIMEQPYPMEVIDAGDRILLHLEEYNTVRTIHLDRDAPPEDAPHRLLGYSVGEWDGNTLEVTTTRLGWGHYDTVGIPLSRDAELYEEFTLAEDGSRLDWSMTITDPSTFTEPVTVEKYWFYVPGVTVEPFACVASQ